MKRNTYPVAENAQAVAYREIFKDDTKVGRVKGINNSPNLVSLFPNSPFNTGGIENDRGNLLDSETTTGPLTNDLIAKMFQAVIDGKHEFDEVTNEIFRVTPHVTKSNEPGHNYNWLYRDTRMDMNFKYLDEAGNSNSPNADTAPVGSNAPIPDNLAPSDHPFWGHANLNVPSVNWNEPRGSHFKDGKGIPQLQRGSGGFGTVYTVSNKAFAAQEKIGFYFTNSYIDAKVAGTETAPLDRMNKTTGVNGKSIKDDSNTIADNNSNLYQNIDKEFN